MTYERLKLARDCWWANPSGDNYVSDEGGNLSTYSHGVYKSINEGLGNNDSKYLKFNGVGVPFDAAPGGGPAPTGSKTVKYTTRLKSTNIVPDSIEVGIRAETTLALPVTAEIFVNDLSLGQFGSWTTKANASGVFTLDTPQKERIFNGRIEDNYDYFQVRFETSDADPMDLKLYDMEVYYSGETNWNNHETGLPNVSTSYHYPTTLGFRGGSAWIDGAGDTVDSSGYYTIDIDPDHGSADNEYIKHHFPSVASSGAPWGTDPMPSGGLSLYFTATSGTVEPLQSVTRAQLKLRMSLPPSGTYENSRDTFEVNGYNRKAKEGDYLEDMLHIAGTEQPRDRQFGYFIYGAGDIVEDPSFKNYTVELNFLDPNLYAANSGNISSVYHRNADMFADIEMQLVGLPSGVRLSAAELLLEQRPNNFAPLYTIGGYNVAKKTDGVYPDGSGTPNVSLGNGGWHHRGLRAEGETFDEFFGFTEASGTLTLSNTTGRHATYRNYGYTATKEPTRKNYYRSPIVSSVSINSPTYYRDMLKISNLEAVVDFGNTITLGSDFTLYFMIYNDTTDDTLENKSIFFVRQYGLDAQAKPEIVGRCLDATHIDFIVFDTLGNYYTVTCQHERANEPILVWVNCQYSSATNQTTLTLYTHEHPENYFAYDWNSDSVSFTGYRRITIGDDAGTPIYAQMNIGGSTIFQDDGESANDNFYVGEFGYTNSYIALTDDLTSAATNTDYCVSPDLDKEFLSSRMMVGPYLDNIGSGINWNVEAGSGEAVWNTRLFIDDWIDSATYYELAGPITSAYTNYVSDPSGIVMEINATHSTDHPSGVILVADIEIDSAATDNWKVWETDAYIPSGTATTFTRTFKRHIGMNSGPIKYSDISNMTLNLKTTYPDLGGTTTYNGNLTINSVKVYFDSYCVAATGTNQLNLYTNGTATTNNNSLDLFAKGHTPTVIPSLDLYVNGRAPQASGDITLYTVSSHYPYPPASDPDVTKVPLYVEGYDPPNASGDLDLFVWGTDELGIRYNMPLYTASYYDKGPSLPLYLYAVDGSGNANMNLYLYNNPWTPANNSVSLVTVGPSGINNTTPLYVKGYGTTSGWYWKSGNMNMFIARDSEATASHMPLFVGQNAVTNTFNLVIEGTELANSSVPLYIYGSGTPNANLEFYTHGF